MPKIKSSTSIVVPVLHEEGRIGSVVEHARALAAPGPVEIIVVDGDPGGGTLAALELNGVTGFTASGGRAGQMNAGAHAAMGEALVFLHVDTLLPEMALHRVHEALAAGFPAGAFSLAFDSRDPRIRLVAASGRMRSAISRVPFGDQAQFFRRGYFMDVGGYADLPLMEDVEIMRRIKLRGDRIRILPDRVMTSARRYEREGIMRCMLRNWRLQIAYRLGADPKDLVQSYRFNLKEEP